MRLSILLVSLIACLPLSAQAKRLALHVTEANVFNDAQTDTRGVDVQIDKKSQMLMAGFTDKLVGKTVYIRVNNILLFSPTVRGPISGAGLRLSTADDFDGKSPEEIAKIILDRKTITIDDEG